MIASDPTWFIVGAYGVTLVLLAAEIWQLAHRSRAQARPTTREPDDEA